MAFVRRSRTASRERSDEVLPVANATYLFPGSGIGQRWPTRTELESLSPIIVELPPFAGTASIPVKLPTRIVSLPTHATPYGTATVNALTLTTCPPSTATFFSALPSVNASHRPSGENARFRPATVALLTSSTERGTSSLVRRMNV